MLLTYNTNNMNVSKILRPVIIEVPHFASTRGKEREITILRSDTGESWREHTLEASEEAVQDVLNESFEGEGNALMADLFIWFYFEFENSFCKRNWIVILLLLFDI